MIKQGRKVTLIDDYKEKTVEHMAMLADRISRALADQSRRARSIKRQVKKKDRHKTIYELNQEWIQSHSM